MSLLHFPHRRAQVIDISHTAECPACGSRVRVIMTHVDCLDPGAAPRLPRYIKHARESGLLCRGSYTVVGIQHAD